MQRISLPGWWRRLAVVFALTLTLAAAGAGPAGAQAPAEFLPGEILVKFDPGAPGEAIAEAHRRTGGQAQEVIPGIDVQVVRVPAGQERARVAAYERNPNVLFAEVNGRYSAIGAAADPQAAQQWQYNNRGQTTGSKADADIDAFEAWDSTTGSAAVAIAILDTGIDQDHEDLQGKVTKSINFTDSSTVDDNYGHGTHVAGSAAAATNNTDASGTYVGVAGTCPNCVLYNVKVLNDGGGGAWSWIANGIRWSADNGAKVVSMSLGGYFGSNTMKSAVDYAASKNVVLVAAAGNDNTNWRSYPAAYTNVIAVAATDHADAKAGFSNYGSWVDVAAPGVNILSTAPNHPNSIWGATATGYGTISGTSMATPHAAGVAGLVWSATGANGAALCSTSSCVRSRIEGRADKIVGTGSYWAYGRINAQRSVTP